MINLLECAFKRFEFTSFKLLPLAAVTILCVAQANAAILLVTRFDDTASGGAAGTGTGNPNDLRFPSTWRPLATPSNSSAALRRAPLR